MVENTLSTVHNQTREEADTTASSYEFLLGSMVWSFSRVNAYVTCPKMFKLQYIDHVTKLQNAFAEWGTLCHGVLESYFKGEKSLFELSEAYEQSYHDIVQHAFPPNKYVDLSKSYFDAGLDYFDNFQGLPAQYEVIGVEQEVHLEFGGYQFIGYIDLILRDKEDNGIVIVDHKSKAKFESAPEKEHYLLQLYLYSQYIFERFHEYPKRLIFNMFRAGKLEDAVFEPKDFDAAVQWFISTINSIYADKKYIDKIAIEYAKKGKSLSSFKKGDFFCNHLCSVREHCNRSADKR